MKLSISILLSLTLATLGACPAATAQEVKSEPMEQGKYQPTWESLSSYECPDWYRDAKFGIWAHWGPQCEPEAGDWYARNMYYPGQWQQEVHLKKYGDPKDFGFKDVIHEWKAERWQPDSLIRFYKSVGAKFFMTLANHHDNFDLWDSQYQPWNSVNMGPKRDIVGEWAKACRKYGLPLGVSVHASHAWTWYEGSQRYDGKLTKADGKGKWWEGYDPQDLYQQSHERSKNSWDVNAIHSQWAWGNGASQPSEAFKTNVYNRTLDLINRYSPDVLYFDDTVLPFYPINAQGFNEGRQTYSAADIRYVQKGAVVYATALGWPDNGVVRLETLRKDSPYCHREVKGVELLGHGSVDYDRDGTSLTIYLPKDKPNPIAPVFKVTFLE